MSGLPLPSEMFSDVTLTRYAAGSYVGGRWVEGASSSVTITACVQPATPRDLLRLEEGDRTSEAIAVWSPDAMQSLNETAGTQPDRISYDGKTWLVKIVEWWDPTPQLTHYRALAVREQKA